MRARLTMLTGVAAVVLAACTPTASVDSGSPSPEASVESASPGQVAKYVDNKSRCTSRWNFDTTANVQLLNKIQRVGVDSQWKESSATGMALQQDAKFWPTDPWDLSSEGEWDCKAIPWRISNDRSRVYSFSGGEWTGSGDNDFFWGHTQDVSGAIDEPNGWVSWKCVGTPEQGGDCPEKALESNVTVRWDAENDGYTKLEFDSPCESSSNAAVGCWQSSGYGGQYEGQFDFKATAWTAPMRINLTARAKDDQLNSIVWKVSRAETSGVIWANSTASPEGRFIVPNVGLVLGGYATATNGEHTINLQLTPAYTVDAAGQPQKCTYNEKLKKYECVSVPNTGDGGKVPEGATPPVLANIPKVYVSVALNLTNVSPTSGPPVAKAVTNDDLCYAKPGASQLTFSVECDQAGTPFTYGGAWTVDIKTSSK